MRRLFNAHIQLAYEDNVDAAVNAVIADRAVFWWNDRKPGESSLWESKIELGEKFFNEIINHPVPLDMNILKALKRSSLGIDFLPVVDVQDLHSEVPAASLLGEPLPPVRLGSRQGGIQAYR